MLSRRSKRKKVEKSLSALNSYTLMKKVEVSRRDALDVLQDLERYNLDYAYALTLQAMKGLNVTEIYTNDKDLDRVEWVREFGSREPS
ncbi:MAG: PIN domain-containing protein [Thermofilaceae archaeon]|nr:PIN domain-containing protein [Thermofilaceae archaeon]